VSQIAAGVCRGCPKEYLLDPEILGRIIPETGGLASMQQRCSTVLLDEANGALNAGMHCVIVCYYHLGHDIVFGAMF